MCSPLAAVFVQVRKVIWDLFKLAPTAEAMAAADLEAISRVMLPLGLHKRGAMLQRFSQEYTAKNVRASGRLSLAPCPYSLFETLPAAPH